MKIRKRYLSKVTPIYGLSVPERYSPKEELLVSKEELLVSEVKVRTFPDGRLDAKNSALYIGLSEKTLATLRCNGKGPKFIKPGRIFYFKSDIDEWLNQNGRLSITTQARHNK